MDKRPKFSCKVEICFNGDSSIKEAFIYELEQLGNGWEVVIKEEKGGGCWDIIVYNRFFEDEDAQKLVEDDEVFVR